ncbi:MAG: hypothetical protein KDA44_12540, partial [Planctomycetales bacterium]|nr:hypothetical protein [Planctomycetales bacterium]
MPFTLTLRAADCTPMDFRGVTPDAWRGATLREFLQCRVLSGNRPTALGELVEAVGDPGEDEWQFAGDWPNVHGIGVGLADGEIVVEGSAGRHAGVG